MQTLYIESTNFIIEKNAFKGCFNLEKIILPNKEVYKKLKNSGELDASGLRDGVEICFEDGSPSITYRKLIVIEMK